MLHGDIIGWMNCFRKNNNFIIKIELVHFAKYKRLKQSHESFLCDFCNVKTADEQVTTRRNKPSQN